MATKNQPVKEVRLGRIKAVIWKNPGSNGNGPLLNITLARLYKDPESDNWKESQSLGRDDLLPAAKVLGEVHTWVHFSGTKNGLTSDCELCTLVSYGYAMDFPSIIGVRGQRLEGGGMFVLRPALDAHERTWVWHPGMVTGQCG